MKTATKVMVAAVLMVTVAAMALPAGATATGAVAFQCTASLPEFPSPGNNGTCSGLSAGSIAGTLDAGGPSGDTGYAIAGAGGFNAAFSYNETCVLNEPPAIGTANGTTTVGPSTAALAPSGTVTTATVNAPFAWTRVGLTAVVLVGGLSGGGNKSITFGTGDTASDSVGGVAVAAFAPLIGPGNVCPVGGPLTAQVVGLDAELV